MGGRAVEVGHAQSRLPELIRRAARGEDVILTEEGEPVARIIPITRARGSREFGSAKGLIYMAEDFDAPLEDSGDYM